MSGYNKNSVKMNVLGSTSANQGDVVQVDLPTNSIVDLSSLAWSYDCTYSAAAIANTKKAACPINAETIIDRLAIEVNGQTLVNITNYNVLYHALLYMTATDDYIRQRRMGQTNNESGEGSGVSVELTGLDDGGTAKTDARRHVIDTWLGFLGSAKPNFIDTSLLGNVRITITLAPATIIQNIDSDGGVIASSYALANQFFSIDVVSISDGVYDAMVDQMLASGAPIEIPFKNYFSFQGEASANQLAFNVASQSIDRMWGLMRAKDHAKQTHATLPAVSGGTGDLVETTDRSFTYATAGATNFHFQVNNTLYPQWTSGNAQDWFQHTKLALGDQGNMLAGSYVTCPDSYVENFFVYACQLEHRSDNDERFVSGIDTRGAAAQCYWNWDSGAGTHHAIVFGECTSLLRVFSNKVVEIVQ
jgi:hypothetical protein